jgi:hypothetical protein
MLSKLNINFSLFQDIFILPQIRKIFKIKYLFEDFGKIDASNHLRQIHVALVLTGWKSAVFG